MEFVGNAPGPFLGVVETRRQLPLAAAFEALGGGENILAVPEFEGWHLAEGGEPAEFVGRDGKLATVPEQIGSQGGRQRERVFNARGFPPAGEERLGVLLGERDRSGVGSHE